MLALLAAFAPFGVAQEVTAAITGKITDPSGAAILNATVTARDMDRGTAVKTQSNEEGNFILPRVPIGRYEIRVEATGFQTAVRSGVQLVLNQTARLDFTMKLGAVSETVEVSGAAPLLQTETTQLGTVMESHAITSLPLETRNYNQLALLMPGTVTTSPAAFNTGQKTFNSGRPYINGNREQANYYLLDGVDNNEFVDNNVAYSPSVDAIQEFNVIANNPNAEFGHFLGGVISVSIKSGTNQFHGSAFEYLRRDSMNANEWSNNFNNIPKQKMKWDEFGGTVGGPIKKDKLFFFADYQGSRFNRPPSQTAISTFTDLNRTGNLSDIPGIALHYPGTTVAMPADLTKAAICGPGQKMGVHPCIPGLSPVAMKILGVLPKADNPGTPGTNGTGGNLMNTTETYTHGDQGDLKIDWAPTENDRLFARYSQQHIFNPTINSQPLLYNGTGNNIFPIQNGVLNYSRTVTPTLVNEFRAGVNYYPAEANMQDAGTANVSGLIPGQPTAFLPGLYFLGSPVGGAFNGPFAFGTTYSPEVFHQTVIYLADTAVLSHGAHTMRMGVQIQRYRNNYIPATTSDGAAGQIGFSGQYTGNAEADFLLGLPQYIGYGQGFAGTVGQRNSALGAFFQDDWRISSRLTINMGLRWQLFTPIYEVHDRMTNFGEYTGQIMLAGRDGNSRALYNQYNGIANFLPRLGVAWTPFGGNTVIRAAFSRSSFQEGTGEYNRLPTNSPWNIDLVSQPTPGANGAIPANQIFLDQGFSALGATGGVPCTPDTVKSAPASCFAGVRLHMTDPNYRPAVSNQWNISVQRQFGNALVLQAAYIGQHNDHLANIYNAGQRVLLPDGTTIPGPYLGGNPTLKNGGTGQVRLNMSTGIQNYNALQLTAQQRLTKGLAFQVNYTWAKCLTNSPGYYGRYGDATASQASADKAFQEYSYNLGLDYGYCDHDVRSAMNGYVNYDLPIGRNRTFGKNFGKAMDTVLGGWEVNAIFTAHGGFPISMYDFSDPSGTGSFEPRPDCTGPAIPTPFAPNPYGPGYRWFDPSNMAHPQPGHLGNCPVGSNRGPGLKQVDLGLSKIFAITERQNFEFRAEAINAFNTPVFVVNGFVVDIFGAPSAGVINTSQGARNIQLAFKYHF